MKTLRFILTARLLIGCVAVWGLLQSYTPAASPEPAPDLGDLLQRIQAYTDTFYGEFGNCVLEEKYTQRLKGTDNRMQPVLQIRVLRADVLLVWVESAQQWALFRDVYEVDGKDIRERGDRLQRLFLTAPAELDAVTAESARYNIGPARRNINVPTLVLSFLKKEHIARFEFKLDGKDKIEGQVTVKLDFTETGRPTMISNRGQDVFSKGSVWVDPRTGVVRRTRLAVQGLGSGEPRAEIVVTFKEPGASGIAVPAHMTERYTFPGSRSGALAPDISGQAEYTNIRKFGIQTESTVAPPEDRKE
ncbi:MAG TPA: hypothetical protein PKN61_05280 [Acidobacteriota bacterium]|jgi:hypothetical protein|nr:hypothetical protein [Acidobacteriota bacterium]HNR38428.1 hypothetical protein [Acidobacteriota bacterium]HNU00915.1 hypothetical protein [Acidobacteriota bacterium]HQF86390.1 hypothetical protein [Acidobacteriota bacterium]HQG90367.1 hypothetical protein [Acidobacteriota bacterium]